MKNLLSWLFAILICLIGGVSGVFFFNLKGFVLIKLITGCLYVLLILEPCLIFWVGYIKKIFREKDI